MDNSDQWKIDGDCKVCRRQSYCTKACTLAKTRLDRVFQRELAKQLAAKKAAETDSQQAESL